ncbi:AraC family transcriptional regulator [Sphingobacterium alkalisoli]|uniref:AraC family transcriptional regulator n=1 Tax=Sphingobacterium alkalisoli TaxID=1874115 RepID=A0A4U0GLY3_9SPHI|nr:helix-turn-helix domain-containing protein [Sphingobacterium alkalisoli]TJY59698.1 AraC family transcriptional regulator [Sphingobacterium alkalisoli]GGH33094.1 hypothetical protein GCM10011418_47070 [Sphingobacterium alkalisoli]
MKRTYTLQLDGTYIPVSEPVHPLSYTVRHAESLYWESGKNVIYEQTFDGRFAYLYYYECWIQEKDTIPIAIDMPDIHLLYTLQCDGCIAAWQAETDFAFDLIEGKGAYYYFAAGRYHLQLPKGHHILIGFILDAGMIRPPANRNFKFLSPLIDSKRMKDTTSKKSPDVRVGAVTLKFLQLLFSKINPYILDNEYILLKHLTFLINLSRFKMQDDSDAPHEHRQLIAKAREILALLILHQGAKAKLADVAQTLLVSGAHLNSLHQEYHGCAFQVYRNELMLDFIRDAMHEEEKFAATAEQTGFSGFSEMARFIRNHTGLTSKEFREQSKQT